MSHINLMKSEDRKIPVKKRIVFYFLMIVIIIGGYFFIFDRIYASTIYPRVYCCNNFSLSGLGPKEARTLLEIFIKGVDSNGYTFYAQTELGEKQAAIHPNLIAPADPDLSRSLIRFDVEATIKNAYAVGREGDFIQRVFKKISSIVSSNRLDLIVEVEEQEVKEILKEQFEELEKPERNAHIVLSDSNLILKPETAGFVLDYTDAVNQLKHSLKQLILDNIQIKIVLQEPDIRYEDVLDVFALSQDLFNTAPYVLLYKDKEWSIEKEHIGQWLEFRRDQKSFVRLKFNTDKVGQYLDTIAHTINIEPREHYIVIENNRVKNFQVGAPGLYLDIDKSLQIIEDSILSEKTNKTINLVVSKAEPASLPEDVDSLGIKELIGKGVSNFSGSPQNRRHNIKVGAQKLHGILIAPDEEFSLINALGEINKDEGFLSELVIKGDRTVPEYGGGLCQIATTAFRVAVNAGLSITERRNHSYRVAYYEPAGMDATIYIPQPDLKFINDTGHHILFQATVEGNELIFEFYGTSDGRVIETTKPKVYNIVDPGPPQYIEVDELAPGEKKRVESSHFGADAKFKNTVTFANGIERVDIWRSHYKPWPEVWMVGRPLEQKDTETIE